MGRANPNFTPPPPNAIRRAQRAKEAKHIINNVVPALLKSDARARKGADASFLIHNSETQNQSKNAPQTPGAHDPNTPLETKGKAKRKSKSKSKRRIHDDAQEEDPIPSTSTPQTTPSAPLTVSIAITDTLHAAHTLHLSLPPSRTPSTKPPISLLNMSSPLRPGGGLLRGATSQEETLCAHTTLLPSLHESFYRLPERGCVVTPAVLVFSVPGDPGRGGQGGPGGQPRALGKAERFYVSVVSAAALRFPDIVEAHAHAHAQTHATGSDGSGSGGGAAEGQGRSKKVYASPTAAPLVRAKMRGVLRAMQACGARRAVLGAWGCGAYGNPVGEVARAWRAVLVGEEGGVRPEWAPLEEVVFAIRDGRMAREFGEEWGAGMEVVERGEKGEVEDKKAVAESRVRGELEEKIAELEGQVERSMFPERVRPILEALKRQRAELGNEEGSEDRAEVDDEVEDDYDMDEDDEATWSDDGLTSNSK